MQIKFYKCQYILNGEYVQLDAELDDDDLQ